MIDAKGTGEIEALSSNLTLKREKENSVPNELEKGDHSPKISVIKSVVKN